MRVLLIGDSISMGYAPGVRRFLARRAEVIRPPSNHEDSAKVRRHLQEWLGGTAWDVVHFNCGLHDLKCFPPDSQYQVPLADYAANLREIVRILRGQTQARLLWATTTAVIDDLHQQAKGGAFSRHEKDVQAYNLAARRVMTGQGVAIDDLHATVQEAGLESVLGPDGVHFSEDGYERLARAVAHAVNAPTGSGGDNAQ